MAGKLSLRIQQLDVRCETKSKDNGALLLEAVCRVVRDMVYCSLYDEPLTSLPCDPSTPPAVFVDIVVSVQYQVVRENVYDAFYKLTDSKSQIRSYGACMGLAASTHVGVIRGTGSFSVESPRGACQASCALHPTFPVPSPTPHSV